MTTKWVVFDIEGDGLRPTKLYCISWRDHEKTSGTEITAEGMVEFFSRYDVYIGHNIRRFDIPRCIQRCLGIDPQVRWVDTLALAWYLFPGRTSYGLESFGPDYGHEKVQIDDWENLDLDSYIRRCEGDIDINYDLWLDCLSYLIELYGRDNLWGILKYLDFKMYCAYLAEESRWKVDVPYLTDAIHKLEALKEKKFGELKSVLPKIPIVRTYERPKRFCNSDGQLSVLGHRWQERVRERGLPDDYDGPLEVIIGEDEGNPNSSEQIKEWLFSLGWKPQTYKHTKNKKTGEEKSIPQINSKPGTLCESVKELFDVEPNLEYLEGYSVLTHRLGLLRGFYANMSDDGYLTAAVAGLTNTLRFKHAEIVNLPRVGGLWTDEVRGSLIAEDGYELCGADMSSLEDRLKQHFIYPFDPEYVNELNTPDYDPHLDLARQAGAITDNDVRGYKANEKDCVLRVKPIRSVYKNGNYACQYGAGVSRLAITCGCDLDTARRIHEAYWKRNWAIKAVVDEQVVKTVRGQMWLFNPISEFWYSLRFKKDIFSTLVQGSAVYCFDLWVRQVVDRRPQLTGQFHDEIIQHVKKGYREQITEFLQETIEKVNDILQLNRRLDIGIQFGHRYSEIH